MTKRLKRKQLTVYDYKNRITKINLPKNGYWWQNRIGDKLGSLHCVISCYNSSDVFYISDYGLCSIAYCDAHARSRILESMFGEDLQRGLWCIANNGKLEPHWYYKRFMSQLKKLNPKSAKKLEQKIKEFKKKQ